MVGVFTNKSDQATTASVLGPSFDPMSPPWALLPTTTQVRFHCRVQWLISDLISYYEAEAAPICINPLCVPLVSALKQGGGYFQILTADGSGDVFDCRLFAADVTAWNNRAGTDGGGFLSSLGPATVTSNGMDNHDSTGRMVRCSVSAERVIVTNNSAGVQHELLDSPCGFS